jgi:hypothetical protein
MSEPACAASLPDVSLGCAPVAQLDRANASGALGREFESLRAHHSGSPVTKNYNWLRELGPLAAQTGLDQEDKASFFHAISGKLQDK